jgi:hypothetical protein
MAEGATFVIEYLPLFHDLGMPRQARVFEWWAGPEFIGFALLGYGFCNTIISFALKYNFLIKIRRLVGL